MIQSDRLIKIRQFRSHFLAWFFAAPAEKPDHGDRKFEGDLAWAWGKFPTISFLGAICLFLISVGFNLARRSQPYHELVFWIGLLSFYGLITWRLTSGETSRRERVALVLFAGLGLYLVKVMHSPIRFTFYDELLHYRTVSNILETGRQFSMHPLLPISPLYPGLENITVALVQLGGLDIFSAGILTIFIGRVILIFTLFLFYEKATKSPRLAGLATLIYTANPHFIFFDSQFSYESIALVFVVIVLLSVEYRIHHHRDKPLGASLLLIFGICATLITHHVTSYFLLFCLIVWALVAFIFPYEGQARTALVGTAWLGIVAILSWMMYVAIVTIDYLLPVLSGAVLDLFKVLLREETGRRLFSGDGENILRIWEQYIVYGTAFLTLTGIVLGALAIWREHRNRTTYLFLGVVGCMYPITQLLRFSEKGPEVASRFGPFMFLGIAFVVAVMASSMIRNSESSMDFRNRLGVSTAILIIFWGNFLVSFPRWALMPGSYLASADTRSVDIESIEVAGWVRDHLGPYQRFAADRINGLILVANSDANQVTGSWNAINVPGIFLNIPYSPVEYRTLCDGNINYLLVDYRFTTHEPMLGFYYELGENSNKYHGPLEPVVFDKFSLQPEFSRIYTDGTIMIYKVDLANCEHAEN